MISLDPVQSRQTTGRPFAPNGSAGGTDFAQLVAAVAGCGPAAVSPGDPETGDKTQDPAAAEACAEAKDEQLAPAGAWPGLSPALAPPPPDPGPADSLEADAPLSAAEDAQTDPAATFCPFSVDDAVPDGLDVGAAEPVRAGRDAAPPTPTPTPDSDVTAALAATPPLAPAPDLPVQAAAPFGVAAAPAAMVAPGSSLPQSQLHATAQASRPFGQPDPAQQDTPVAPRSPRSDLGAPLRAAPAGPAGDRDDRSRASWAAASGDTPAGTVTTGPVEPSAAPLLARSSPPPLTEQGPRSAPQIPPHRQIADAIVRSSGSVVEITLAPVELGRLTVVIGTSGAGTRLGVIAERPETLELIRRHSDMLLRDLRDSGLPDAQLSYQRSDAAERPFQAGSTAGGHAPGDAGAQADGPGTQGGQSQGDSRPGGDPDGSAGEPDQITPAAGPSRPHAGSHSRLDIRV